MQLSVKDLNGKNLHLECETGTTTINDLVRKIELQVGIPSDQWHLVFAGRIIQDYEDGIALKDFNIGDKAQLYLVLKLKG